MEMLPVQMFTGKEAGRRFARELLQYCHLLCKNSLNILKGIFNFLQNVKIVIAVCTGITPVLPFAVQKFPQHFEGYF